MRWMKSLYSKAGKTYRSTAAVRASAALVIVTVVLCIATMRVPIYNGFFTAFEPNNVHHFPQLRNCPYSTDERLLLDSIEASRRPLPASAAPKIAFLFLVRGDIPFEPLWRRYFAGHEGRYSLYVHANPNYTFPSSSLFFGKEIPSRDVQRLSKSLAAAVRRLFAMALLDWESNNAWFVNLCESTIPLRSFNATYEYLMGSQHSFVQAFQPTQHYTDAIPYFDAATEFRKGEVWMALNRKHTITLVADRDVWSTFSEKCLEFCYFDESYFQTLLHLKDPGGIANRTVMFVDWYFGHGSSPRTYDGSTTNAIRLREIASLTEDSIYGQHHDSAFQQNVTVRCENNGVSGAACFLFARKFDPSALDAAMAWLSHIEEFESQFSANVSANPRRRSLLSP